MKYEKIIGKTPNGGAYSEIYYLDDDNNAVEKSKASKCIIRECTNDGTIINEIFGVCNN